MDERLIVEDLLAKHHGMKLLTPIFQSDDTSIGNGVCRGIAAKWIGVHLGGVLQSPKAVSDFRRQATNTTGKVALELKQFHYAFEYVGREFENALSDQQKKLEIAKRLVGQRKGTISVGFFGSRPSQRQVDQAIQALEKAEKVLKKKSDMLHRYMAGGLALMRKRRTVDYSTFVDRVSRYLLLKGYHYVSLRTHALAFFYDPVGECLFLDANTGEWAARSRSNLNNFFVDYMDSIYGSHYAGSQVTLYHAMGTTSDPKHFTEPEPDYSSVELAGFFDD